MTELVATMYRPKNDSHLQNVTIDSLPYECEDTYDRCYLHEQRRSLDTADVLLDQIVLFLARGRANNNESNNHNNSEYVEGPKPIQRTISASAKLETVSAKLAATSTKIEPPALAVPKDDVVKQETPQKAIVKPTPTAAERELKSILVHEDEDTETLRRRAKRFRKIDRRGGVRFAKDEDGSIEVEYHERDFVEEWKNDLHLTQEEKKVFRKLGTLRATEIQEENPDSVNQLCDIYLQCSDKYCDKDFGPDLLQLWIEPINDGRGLEHDCCSQIQKDWMQGVQTMLRYQEVLKRTVDRRDRNGFSKLMRKRSLDVSRRARRFARHIASADALVAEQIYEEEKNVIGENEQ